MKAALTQRERDIIVAVARGSKTYREVSAAVGLKSSSSTWSYVRRLRALGILRGGPAQNTLRLGKDVSVSDTGNIYWVVWMNGYEEEEVHDGAFPVAAASRGGR